MLEPSILERAAPPSSIPIVGLVVACTRRERRHEASICSRLAGMKDDGEEVEDEFTGGLGKVVLQRLLVANRDSSRLKRQRERLGVDVPLLPHEDCDLGEWDAVIFAPRPDAAGHVPIGRGTCWERVCATGYIRGV